MTVRPLLGNERTLSGKKTWIVEWPDGERAQVLVGTRADVLRRLRPHRVQFEHRPWKASSIVRPPA